jgi:hypothetical protein
VFAFGSARFEGSAATSRLDHPVVGIAPTPDGGGYWLVTSGGLVLPMGDAPNLGSVSGPPFGGSLRLNAPIVGMAATPDGGGYWLVGADGGIFAFGDAQFRGSTGGSTLEAPVVGMAVAAGT